MRRTCELINGGARAASFFFLNDPATTEISPLPLHAALPISDRARRAPPPADGRRRRAGPRAVAAATRARQYTVGRALDRKSTRLNSSHSQISYAVFCLKKKSSLQRGV